MPSPDGWTAPDGGVGEPTTGGGAMTGARRKRQTPDPPAFAIATGSTTTADLSGGRAETVYGAPARVS